MSERGRLFLQAVFHTSFLLHFQDVSWIRQGHRALINTTLSHFWFYNLVLKGFCKNISNLSSALRYTKRLREKEVGHEVKRANICRS